MEFDAVFGKKPKIDLLVVCDDYKAAFDLFGEAYNFFEDNGSMIARIPGTYTIKFVDHNFTVEFISKSVLCLQAVNHVRIPGMVFKHMLDKAS